MFVIVASVVEVAGMLYVLVVTITLELIQMGIWKRKGYCRLPKVNSLTYGA